MKPFILLLLLLGLTCFLHAQQKYTYTIKADSVRLTGCDSSELIIENHTQAVSGFLFNTGHGRTIFCRRSEDRINDRMRYTRSNRIMHSHPANVRI